MLLANPDLHRKSQGELSASEAAELLLERRRLRDDLPTFIAKTFCTVDPGSVYMPNWHIDLIAEYLDACYRRQIKKLVINMPPRFLKSISVSVAFPAWVMGQDPSEQFLCSSYSDKLALQHSTDTRLVMESGWYRSAFPETRLARDQNEKSKFQTTERGHRIATSTGGTATGSGGNFLISDDPMSPRLAHSDAERTKTNDWYEQTWSTRKNSPRESVEIIVMQRLHVDDTTGHVLRESGWEHVVIPNEAPERTAVHFPSGREVVREKGELLHPERFGCDETASMKTRLGTYGYAGQYQQAPAPLGGGRIKLGWFPTYRELPVFDEVVLSADTAQKAKDVNDPSVIQVYGRKASQWYLAHEWKNQVTYPDLKKMALAMIGEWKPDAFLIEDKSSGSSLIQELKELKKPVVAIQPEADKVTRMDTQTASIEVGTISLPDPEHYDHEWLASLITNLSQFPNPAAWDELDAMSQFLKWLKARENVVRPRIRVV